MELIERLKAPVSPFMGKVRRLCAAAGAIGLAIMFSPIALPALIITAAGYMVAAGTVGAIVAQVTKDDGSIDLSTMTYDQLCEMRRILGMKERNKHEEKLFSDLFTAIREYAN